jgi:Derlin-2/3
MFTPFFFLGGFSFAFVMNLFFLVQHSRLYELSPYNTGGGGGSADYLVMLLFGFAVMNTLMYIFNERIMSQAMIVLIMYVWSRKEPDAQTGFFGFRFQALYLPWVLVAFHLLMGSNIFQDLVGIGTGHLYYFLVVEVPVHYNVNVISTPRFVVEQLAWFSGTVPPAARGPQGQAFPAPNQWGRGRMLGGR